MFNNKQVIKQKTKKRTRSFFGLRIMEDFQHATKTKLESCYMTVRKCQTRLNL